MIRQSRLGVRCCRLILLAVLAVGCSKKPPEQTSSVSSVPQVQVIKPERRNITARLEQPGFVQAYERTAIYSKVSGFIRHYYVDIGQRLKKGDPIVDIFVPELQEEHQQKVAQVELDRQMVEQAQQLVMVAESKVQTATAQIEEAKANVGKYQADVVRWTSEVKRLTAMVEQHVVDAEILDETQKQLSASQAGHDAAEATVAARQAEKASAAANLGKAKIDVKTARAQVAVAEADERRTAALLAYTKVTAPYDGVITVRNANTGDYVLAATGDESTAKASPMFVIASDNTVRIFTDVPESYARYVHEGTRAEVRVDSLSGLEIKAAVTRTSWTVREKTRTLWVEVDMPISSADLPVENPGRQGNDATTAPRPSGTPTKNVAGLRPGMYVNMTLIAEQPDVLVVPQAALLVSGNETYCYLLQNGKAVKTAVVPGLQDENSIEVIKMKIGGQWLNVTGDEEVIQGSLDELTNGETVNVMRK